MIGLFLGPELRNVGGLDRGQQMSRGAGVVMNTMRRGGWIAAALCLSFTLGVARAQTPPDPLAPGSANTPDPAAAEPAKAAVPDAKAEDKPKAAKVRHKPHRPAEKGGLAITVNNKRSVGLVELTVVPAGDADQRKVAGPLAFGRKTVIHIKKTKDCLYDVRGHFADDADTEQLGVELCKDKVINLTDD